MKFNVKNSCVERQTSGCIIVGVFESKHLSYPAEALNNISKNYIRTLLHRGELEGKIGQTLLLHDIPHVFSERVLLIGCGKEDEFDERQYKKVIYNMINTLKHTGAIEVVCFLTELQVKNRNTYWKVRCAVETVNESLYTFKQLKSDKTDFRHQLEEIAFNLPTHRELSTGKQAIQHGMAISAGIQAAKDLANMPPNLCNSVYLASQSTQLSNDSDKVNTQIIGEDKMKEVGMNAYLAVGQGSSNESLMSIIEYKGHPNPKEQPIILVGKGLTFDSGGISIKPSDSLDEMKYDMCGAATVYGVIRMAIELNLPINIIGVLACCENMIDSRSFRPGDVITTLSGKTVEVLNTDAEGRLVLCDVLTYVERFDPEIVIDIATLTGACVIALGHHLTGLMSNHDPLTHELIIASEQSGDRAWHLPLEDEFQDQLDSNFADLANIGGRPGSTITAGCFLSRFTGKYHWAHLDIAGTAWCSFSKAKSATGRPVAMLSQFLINRSGLMNNNNDEQLQTVAGN